MKQPFEQLCSMNGAMAQLRETYTASSCSNGPCMDERISIYYAFAWSLQHKA
jgi:hypothetical protein